MNLPCDEYPLIPERHQCLVQLCDWLQSATLVIHIATLVIHMATLGLVYKPCEEVLFYQEGFQCIKHREIAFSILLNQTKFSNRITLFRSILHRKGSSFLPN